MCVWGFPVILSWLSIGTVTMLFALLEQQEIPHHCDRLKLGECAVFDVVVRIRNETTEDRCVRNEAFCKESFHEHLHKLIRKQLSPIRQY